MLADLLGFWKYFDTLHNYAYATIAHWVICGVAGWLTVHSHFREVPVLRTIAWQIIVFWLCYQGYELLRHLTEIGTDDGDKDVANGLFGYVIGLLLCTVYHVFRKRYGKPIHTAIYERWRNL